MKAEQQMYELRLMGMMSRYKSLNALDEKDPENILDSYV